MSKVYSAHGERAHARLAPSAAVRWLACPPSVVLGEECGEPDRGSSYALEGTVAHELAELLLVQELMMDDDATRARLAQVRKSEWYTAAMEEAVDDYVSIVLGAYYDALREDATTTIAIERRVRMDQWAPDCYGTADCIITSRERIMVIDLKFGRGVPVAAEGNPQLRLYGLGALATVGRSFVGNVRMMIVQPRLDSTSVEEMTAVELREWGERIRDRAMMAHRGEGSPDAGAHCRWCPVKTRCKVYAEHVEEPVRRAERAEAQMFSPGEIAALLPSIEAYAEWGKMMQEYALALALDGAALPGYKLVEGRSVRKIVYPELAAARLEEAGYTPDQIYKPQELETITALERLVGRKRLPEILGGTLEKPPGKPTLAPETDPRKTWDPVDAEFDFKK